MMLPCCRTTALLRVEAITRARVDFSGEQPADEHEREICDLVVQFAVCAAGAHGIFYRERVELVTVRVTARCGS